MLLTAQFFVSSSEQHFVVCDTIDSDAMEVSWTSSYSYNATRNTCQRHYKLTLQGSPREQGLALVKKHDLKAVTRVGTRKDYLGTIPDFFDASVCIPRDVAHRNQDMTTHGELRGKFDVVSREEVFGVQGKKKTSLVIPSTRTRLLLVSCLTQTVKTLQFITSCRARTEDLATSGPVYSSLEELQRREDIISIRAAAHAQLTAQTSQGELGAGHSPSSNERGDVSMGDMSGLRSSNAASAVTHTADVPGNVDAPILLTEK